MKRAKWICPLRHVNRTQFYPCATCFTRTLIILLSYGAYCRLNSRKNSGKKWLRCCLLLLAHKFESIRNRREINRFCDGDSTPKVAHWVLSKLTLFQCVCWIEMEMDWENGTNDRHTHTHGLKETESEIEWNVKREKYGNFNWCSKVQKKETSLTKTCCFSSVSLCGVTLLFSLYLRQFREIDGCKWSWCNYNYNF